MAAHAFFACICVTCLDELYVCANVYMGKITCTCWHSRRRSVWKCHQKPERTRLSGQLKDKTRINYQTHCRVVHFNYVTLGPKLSETMRYTYMCCVVWSTGCVWAAPPGHRAVVLTVLGPYPLYCEPGMSANVRWT